MALPKDEADWEAEYEQLKAAGPPPGMPPEQFEENLAAYKQAMADPAARERLEEMQRIAAQPEMAQQMAQMAAVMQNKQLMERMGELRNDPDMKEFFEAVEAGGPGVVSQYMSNAEFLSKLGEKLGDIDMQLPGDAYAGASAANQAPPGAQAPPEVENLLQAAKYGDLEATEDLIAVGHDVNMTDAEKRTPLHYAVAYRQLAVLDELLRAGAGLESTDSKGNTPLHYAAGYGRGEFVKRLIEAGASGKAVNDSQHTPHQLVTMEERNPLNQETDVLQLLEKALQ